ncbi:uncharacterized protein DNG_01923 [Cephalotrichum gorgonifer]|uniref:Uncharacterized protein n=1 Tax=Cephalotrichum gorgonifer TaxID=2041049 RepID=A0AAE8MRU6_9PEZI|nr:uncharacterized protein DNG_01923 [Cephalotrichum gorgonifer]
MRGKHIEGSIEHLILRIACSGFQGCSVEDVLSSFSKASSDAQNEAVREDPNGQPVTAGDTPADKATQGIANEENANIWRWITSKPDISVGQGRKWNHLSLEQVLDLPEAPPREDAAAPSDGPSESRDTPTDKVSEPPSDALPPHRPRLYVTESKMWECVAGHGVDYQKLPRFEWLALVGIASIMEKGILQGDLTRLVGQDKRSLPRRTDELARKGYIEKRPILARGCKTSKLWLKAFAPAAPAQNEATETSAEDATPAFPSAALVTDLEPVPWRDHWTGNTIDYAMLGRTIMAVVKEFGVIRYQDLRVKLGVAGHRWQMKVVTRTCRFFIELGLLQYVTASLGNRIFRDCLKFKRDLTSEDLAVFISGGGSAFRFGNNHEPRKPSSKRPEDDAIGAFPTERWNPDKPLTISTLQLILASGTKGITNKGLAFNTIGGCLERHISAVSTAVSMSHSQPSHLRHFQARKDYCRSGRVASYRFFPDGLMSVEELRLPAIVESDAADPLAPDTSSIAPTRPAAGRDYGFRAVELQPRTRPKKEPIAEVNSGKRPADDDDHEGRKRQKTGAATDVSVAVNNENDQVTSEPQDPEHGGDAVESIVAGTPETTTQGVEHEEGTIIARTPVGIARGRGGRKRGRGRKSTTDRDDYAPSSKSKGSSWDCEKCGGTWKNDIGLKYHLTKSRTTCNPAYVENPHPRGSRKPRGGRSRQAPRAVYRLGECKVLAQRKWKGDVAIGTRQSLQRSTLDDASSSSGGDIIQKDTRSLPDTNGLSLPGTFIGGIIDTPLAKARTGLAISSPQKPKLVDSAKRRPRGGVKSSPLSHGTPPRRRKAQDPSTPTSAASEREPTNEPGLGDAYGASELNGGAIDGPSAYPSPDGKAYEAPRDDGLETPEASGDTATDHWIPPFEPSQALKESVATGEARDMLRVREIAEYLLRSNGGAFPSRVSLWHAAVVVWHRTFPKDPIPTYAISQRVVKELARKKRATENMFAFRNSAGSISDCYLLVTHGMDPNLPQFQELKTLMKSSHPRPYIPPAFTHSPTTASSGEDGNAPQWGTGRGKHVMSIEVLDAPVYIYQASQERRAVSNVDDVADEDGQLRCQPVSTVPRGPYKPTPAFKPTATSRWSPSATEWQAVGTPIGGVRFLEPNTHLAEDEIAIDPALEAYRFPDDARDAEDVPEEARLENGDAPPSHRQKLNVQFMQNAEIKRRGDDWPDLEDEFFESGDGSFTVVGSVPDREWGSQHGQQHRTWLSSQAGPKGPVYGPYVPPEHGDYRVSAPTSPVHTRGSAPRGRPRTRRDQALPRPKLKSRTLTTIGGFEGDRPSGPVVAPVTIGDFTSEEALTVAFVAVRLLLGGSNKAIDWGFIMKLFPDQTLEDLRRFWIKLSKDRVHFLGSFTEKFQNEFLTAYENDELPSLNYDNIPGYDWQQLIEWGIALRRTNFVKLPVRRSKGANKTTKRDFVLEDHSEQPRHWHERFFHYQASVFTRFELATSEAAAIKISSKKPTQVPPPDPEPTLLEEAISWVRALCCTPTDRCAPEVVKDKLMTLADDATRVNEVLDQAVNSLNNRRIITKRIRAKPYMLSRPFQTNLAKFGQEKKFRGASEFKAALDETFRRGEAFKMPFLTDDGAHMAVMNLYARGRIEITGTDVPKVPLGFRPGNYESRKMPKTHLLFGLLATPTADYLYDEDIGVLARAAETAPPADAPGRLLPFWLDFFGDANPEMWTKLLGLVCFMLAIRGSMPFHMLSLQTKTYLEDFDLRLLVGWCKDVGLLVEDPRSGGLSVTEWWWLVVGRQREWNSEAEEAIEAEGEMEAAEGPEGKTPRPRGRPRKKNGPGGKGKGKAVETRAASVAT